MLCKKHPGKEAWRTIPKYPDYQVSNKGRVRSKNKVLKVYDSRRKMWKKVNKKGKILKGHKNKDGYIIVDLCNGQRQGIHRLVLLAFKGPCPKDNQCRHFPDGKKDHNCIENLKWGTIDENNKDKIVQGRTTKGKCSYKDLFSKEQFLKIKRTFTADTKGQRREWGSIKSLAKELGVKRSVLYKINQLQLWRTVNGSN